jgi:hypothetical protein
MPSRKRVEPLDELAIELAKLTPEENQRLWDVRQLDYLGPQEYLDWCSYLTRDEAPSREIIGPTAEPFRIE